VFECRVIGGEAQPLEHDEIAWVEIARLGEFPMGKVDRSIARDLAFAGAQ
jgi:hypothetical protein